jgi:hypothetical protein
MKELMLTIQYIIPNVKLTSLAFIIACIYIQEYRSIYSHVDNVYIVMDVIREMKG